MNIIRFKKTMDWAMPPFVSMNVVEDSAACKSIDAEWYMEGYFNPHFEQDLDMEDCPIEINIVCHRGDQLIEDQELMISELLTTYAHELIHYEQYREGRFDFEDIQANEAEADRRENDWKIGWHKKMEDKLIG